MSILIHHFFNSLKIKLNQNFETVKVITVPTCKFLLLHVAQITLKFPKFPIKLNTIITTPIVPGTAVARVFRSQWSSLSEAPDDVEGGIAVDKDMFWKEKRKLELLTQIISEKIECFISRYVNQTRI